jgi:flagellin-like protein
LRVRNLLKNKKGIDTIIATLLMVVIVVIAAGLVFAYGTTLFGALAVAPKTSTENIRLEYASFSSSNKAVNFYLRNIGTTPITLTSYYVKDASGDQYAQTNWSPAPVINPSALLINASIPISTLCVGCTTTGTAFTFQSGYAYTIILTTSKNSQFSFSVVR